MMEIALRKVFKLCPDLQASHPFTFSNVALSNVIQDGKIQNDHLGNTLGDNITPEEQYQIGDPGMTRQSSLEEVYV